MIIYKEHIFKLSLIYNISRNFHKNLNPERNIYINQSAKRCHLPDAFVYFLNSQDSIYNISNKVWSYVIVNDINIELRFNGLTSFNNDTTDWES